MNEDLRCIIGRYLTCLLLGIATGFAAGHVIASQHYQAIIIHLIQGIL